MEQVRDSEEPMVEPRTVCERLGIKLQTLYWLTHSDQISYYKVGRKLRFRWSEILTDFKNRSK